MTTGNPPPNTIRRGVWVMPCRSGGSFLMKSNQAWVAIENETAVNALSCEIWIESFGAPSMRRKALRSPASSVTVMHIFRLSSAAFLAAAATAFSAVAASMLCLTMVMGGSLRILAFHVRFAGRLGGTQNEGD